MKYYGLRVYDLEESMVASGFPMLSEEYTPESFENEVDIVKRVIADDSFDNLHGLASKHTKETVYEDELLKKTVLHFRRACNLGNAKPSSGHDCWTKGVVVNVNIKADQSFWLQFERYHHQDTISSMSSMHRIAKFNINDGTMFSKYVDKRSLEILNEYIEKYNADPTKENFHYVVHNIPEGLELTRRVTTNYLQLKTMRSQRHSHKMYSWSVDFLEMVDNLPGFKYFCLNNK